MINTNWHNAARV